jgi:transposase
LPPSLHWIYQLSHTPGVAKSPGQLQAKRHHEEMDEALSLCGDYVLKTDQNLEAKELWNLYMTLLRAEAGFKMLKGSLGLRPNFHQIETRVEGHIFISILACHLLGIDWKAACPTRRTEFKTARPSTTL